MNVYEFEQKIMAAWSTKEDIELIYKNYLDGKEKMTEDEVANVLIGLSAIHDMRMQQVWEDFEKFVSYVAELRRF